VFNSLSVVNALIQLGHSTLTTHYKPCQRLERQGRNHLQRDSRISSQSSLPRNINQDWSIGMCWRTTRRKWGTQRMSRMMVNEKQNPSGRPLLLKSGPSWCQANHAIISRTITLYIWLVLQAGINNKGFIRLVDQAGVCGCQVSWLDCRRPWLTR